MRLTASSRSMIALAGVLLLLSVPTGCGRQPDANADLRFKISLVNSPEDILTLGAQYIAKRVEAESDGKIVPHVYHSGVLSGGKGKAEIELCQQGSIEMHITTTAYLASIVPKTSVVSLPFLFRDTEQIAALAKSNSRALEIINAELNTKDLNIIAWWPRGFRQLTNNRRPVKTLEDIRGLKIRVMNNPLYADTMNAMGVNAVPMAWGEVYGALQLNTIDGQENAESVVDNAKLHEVQKHMTVWDYSTDMEVVMVNLKWWQNLSDEERRVIQQAAEASVDYEFRLLTESTDLLRKKIAASGMRIHYISDDAKEQFKTAVRPVWKKYEAIFTSDYLSRFLAEVEEL